MVAAANAGLRAGVELAEAQAQAALSADPTSAIDAVAALVEAVNGVKDETIADLEAELWERDLADSQAGSGTE